MNNYGFEQFVTQPTREDHLLDLVLTTDPNIIEIVQEVPGISDHEAIICQLVLYVDKPTSDNLRKVYQYHKADINGIDEEPSNFARFFLSSSPYDNTVENNWLQLKGTLFLLNM